MHTTLSPPETTAEQLSGASAPVFAKDGKRIGVVDVPSPQDRRVLALPSQETTPGRAVRQSEALSSALPLVRVRGADHGKETVLPGYYACVGTMPCANTEYYLFVRFRRDTCGGSAGRKAGGPPGTYSRAGSSGGSPPFPSRRFSHLCCCIRTTCCHARGSGAHLPFASPASTKGTGQPSTERYPQLQHSSKRKLWNRAGRHPHAKPAGVKRLPERAADREQVRVSDGERVPPDPFSRRQKILSIAPTAASRRKCAEMATSVYGAFTAFRRGSIQP